MTKVLPKQLVIGNIPYEVELVKGYIDEAYTGQIDYSKQLIKISDETKDGAKAKVLLHEITHGILQEYGMTRHNKEDFVDRLSVALYDFLIRNDLSFLRNTGDFVSKDSFDSIQYAAGRLGKQPTLPAEVTADVTDKQQSRTRKLPINNERNLSVSIGDLQLTKVGKEDESKEQEEPTFWKTGIKVNEDNVKCYKTRYICSECGNRGTHYLPKVLEHVICHECENEIPKIPATDKGFPDRDSWGNYFITEGVNTNANA